MPQMINSLGTLAQHVAAFPWPGDFFNADDLPGVLDRIHLVGWERRLDGFTLAVAFEEECAITLPGLDGVQVVFGGGAVEGVTVVEAVVRRGTPSTLTFEKIRVALRFSPELLQPAPNDDGTIAEHAQIYVEGAITIDESFDLELPIRVLRRGDGTGFFITAALSPGVLRVTAEFARGGVPELPTLSEDGDSSPERTFLDIHVQPGGVA